MALALQAIGHGQGAYFVLAYDLIEDLRKARAEHTLDRRMRVYLAPKVLVVDEFGIWPYDRESATAFFTLVSARYERGSIILTSNKGFGDWGESYRLRDKRQAGLFSSQQHLPSRPEAAATVPATGGLAAPTVTSCSRPRLIRFGQRGYGWSLHYWGALLSQFPYYILVKQLPARPPTMA